MKRLSVPLLAGLAVLATPLPGAAYDYTPSIRPSTYVPLVSDAPGVVTLNLNASNASANLVMLPFPFTFYGQVFNHVNISLHGYVTFPSRPGHDEQSGGYANPRVSGNHTEQPSVAAPNGYIAAWWDSLTCPAGAVKTQDAVINGSRTFTIEWNRCSPTSGTIQTQIRLTEGSSAIRVYYGEASGTMSGTVGVENPARWSRNPVTDLWTLVATGGTDAAVPMLDPPSGTNGYTVASWPTHRMIQYGRPEAPDLQAGILEGGGGGLELLGLSGTGTVTFELRNAIENGGLETASGVTWDYYLSTGDIFDPEVDPPLGCSHATPETIPGATTETFTEICTATVAPGYYRICTYLDPVSAERPEGAIIEANEENNAYCTPTVAIGAELVGSLTMPTSAAAGSLLDVPVRIENVGSDAAPEFTVQIWLRECDAENGDKDILAWETRLSLDGNDAEELMAEVQVRPDLPAHSYCAVLVIDPDDDVREQDEDNNRYSSCVVNGTVPVQCTGLARPDLQIDQLAVDLPNGCFFGEPIGVTVEVCNSGDVDATSFGIAFYLDTNTTVTISDTMIVAVPQACEDSDECVKLGDAAPICVDGICHAPCVVDTDCGTGGLQCEPSFAISGRSCQWVIEANSCRSVMATADLPTFDTREAAEFEDGSIYFGAIADWTDTVFEFSKTDNVMNTAPGILCWTRKPDFEAVEVRTLPVIASGETVPVFRRVHNRGIVGGAFGYRYVLSSNDVISATDLALELEDIGAVGQDAIGPLGEVTATDFVRLPSGIIPGEYHLGILLDPEDRVVELGEENNSAATTRLVVVGASLQIVTSSLRTATAGTTHAAQLVAAGGRGDYRWSSTGGILPPGIVLEPDGRLHGTPSEVGTYLFEVAVTSGGNIASRFLALEVVAARGPLAVPPGELPPAFQNIPYEAMLGASGGLPPYTWTCSGRPGWLSLGGDRLHGIAAFAAAPVSFTCAVTDANETTVFREYRLGVYPASGIRIRSQDIIGAVGSELSSCITAEGGSGRYDWSIDASSAPEGIVFGEQDNAGCFSGIPKVCGDYLVGVIATDEESGLFDARRLSLIISCSDLRLTTRNLPIAERGVPYESRLETNSPVVVAFELTGGALPRGLALSPDGRISGVVAVGAPAGSYQAAVRFHDEEGRSGIAAISIAVAADPLPDVTIINTETRSGCSASGAGSAPGLVPLAVLALLGLVCRRGSFRRAANAGLAAAALLLPAAAVAQTPLAYKAYQYPKPYEPLTEGKIEVLTKANSHVEITLDGWTVPFFGEKYNKMSFHENGLILFSAFTSTSFPRPIPRVNGTAPVRNFIAAWWDDHTVIASGTMIRHLIRGEAPNRELVFEWIWRTATTNDLDDGGEHQVSIFEDGTIAFRWGEIIDSGKGSHGAVMGMMDAFATRYVAFHECSVYTGSTQPRCNADVWKNDLRDTEAIFTTLPNLQILATSTHGSGLAGLDQKFSATVYNDGPFPTPVQVRFYVSRDEQVSEDDFVFMTAQTEVGGFAEQVVEFEAALPVEFEPGRYFLIAVADPDDRVKEYVETDNVGPAYAFRVGEAVPDLTVFRVAGPASAGPGSRITVDLAVENLGNLAGGEFPYAVVLSDNVIITRTDQVLHEGTLSIGALQNLEWQVPVTIPFGTSAGLYYLGLVLDPHGTALELDTLNNAGAAEQPIVVGTSGVTVRTVAPRSIQIGAGFCIPLVAEGGDGVYTWDLVDGTLPPGIDLMSGDEASDAALCGRPTAVGLYDFTLEVVSDRQSARMELTLEVVAGALEFGISSRVLLTAQFQRAYEAGLVAFGGTPPYSWTLEEGGLPIGLSFEDDGLIFGTPLEAGTFSPVVSVADSAGRIATETVTLLVVPPSRVTCATRTLGTLALGEPFAGQLRAAGGPGGYQWTTLNIRRVGDSGSGMVEGEAPPGLELDSGGEITGTPAQVGSYIWTIEVRSVIDEDWDVCPVTVTVVGGQGLTVISSVLPDAVPDEEYAARLWAINGTGELIWSLAAGARLPEGLVLDSTGFLSGTPTPAVLRDETSRIFGFLVEVRDDRNLQGSGLLSLTVTRAPDAEGKIRVVDRIEDDGCQAAGGGSGLGALGLLIVALARRFSR